MQQYPELCVQINKLYHYMYITLPFLILFFPKDDFHKNTFQYNQ